MQTRTTLATILLAGLAGCASCDTVPETAVTDCNAQIVPGGAATDLLFVIDDSGSMTPKQVKLAAQLSTFIDQLLSSAIALDLHVAVTNSSVDAFGSGPGAPGGSVYGSPRFPGPRGTPYPAGTMIAIEQDPSGVGSAAHFMWGTAYDPRSGTSIDPSLLVSTWGGPRLLSSSTSTPADLARDFKANVLQGQWGSGKEQPLRAMALALAKAGAGGPNFPFQRAGARLAVVIVTDEDDCSDSAAPYLISDGLCHDPAHWGDLDPLPDFVASVTAVDPEPVVAVIGEYVGTTAQVCETGPFPSGNPVAPARLDRFLTELDPGGTHTLRASLCDDFGTILLRVAEQIIPQTMPLKQAPADYRMIAVSVTKASGEVRGCGAIEPAPSASANVVYHPAPDGGPSLTFQNACRLSVGDKVNLDIVCAR